MTAISARRFGLIGTGSAGEAYIRALSGRDDTKLVAIAEPEDQLLNQTLSYLKSLPPAASPGVFTDWKEMLDSTPLDALIVTRTDPGGRDVSRALGNNRLGLLMPVPSGKVADRAASLLKQIRKRRAPVQLALTARCHDSFQQLRERIASGDLGEVRRLDIHADIPQLPSFVGQAERVLADVLDLAGLVLGELPDLVLASAAPRKWRSSSPDSLPQSLVLTLDGPRNGHALITLTRKAGLIAPEMRLDAFGSEGELSCKVRTLSGASDNFGYAESDQVLTQQLSAFGAALSASGAKRKPAHGEALRVLALLDAVGRSLKSGRAVKPVKAR